MNENEKDENVYGENHPASEDTGSRGRDIRKEITDQTDDKGDVASDLDAARERSSEPGGGMGRKNTPKDGSSQGGWQRPEEPLPEGS